MTVKAEILMCTTKAEKIECCRTYFNQILEEKDPQRTLQLVDLMNVMEREFGTFRIYPTEEFMAREAVSYTHLSIEICSDKTDFIENNKTMEGIG